MQGAPTVAEQTRPRVRTPPPQQASEPVKLSPPSLPLQPTPERNIRRIQGGRRGRVYLNQSGEDSFEFNCAHSMTSTAYVESTAAAPRGTPAYLRKPRSCSGSRCRRPESPECWQRTLGLLISKNEIRRQNHRRQGEIYRGRCDRERDSALGNLGKTCSTRRGWLEAFDPGIF